ncbi:WecB/TagA/CpsF family glycosyltransferase [Microbulbifer sp. SA54]|uniref:WecB/TagA/CpsF family glycosyltransferase n=1 Tax=Microbulbifer sp. SA54 TaxID=3401577 RepID=UPI003AAAE4E0
MDIEEATRQVLVLAKSNLPHIVVTPNMDHAERLCKEGADSEFVSAYKESSLVLCDSRILQKLAQWAGAGIPEVVEGSSLTEKLFNSALTSQHKICILGGPPEVIVKLRSLYSDLNICHLNPSMGFIYKADEVASICAYVKKTDADFIFLALGSPQQELLAKRLKHSGLSRGVILCIGASMLFLTNVESRAPVWIRNLRMEWFYRMVQNPRRLIARYFGNACSAMTIFKQIKLAGTK